MCPGSTDPFYIASLLYKMGHYFLDILYKSAVISGTPSKSSFVSRSINRAFDSTTRWGRCVQSIVYTLMPRQIIHAVNTQKISKTWEENAFYFSLLSYLMACRENLNVH